MNVRNVIYVNASDETIDAIEEIIDKYYLCDVEIVVPIVQNVLQEDEYVKLVVGYPAYIEWVGVGKDYIN